MEASFRLCPEALGAVQAPYRPIVVRRAAVSLGNTWGWLLVYQEAD